MKFTGYSSYTYDPNKKTPEQMNAKKMAHQLRQLVATARAKGLTDAGIFLQTQIGDLDNFYLHGIQPMLELSSI